jgi:PAS domain S-box-containing protein
MHFAGAMLDGSLLIVAARSYSGLARFSQELMSINNEQANALREALKELSLQSRREALRDSRLYDDLSRVNNELTNLQREMVKKNVELEKLSHSLRRSEAKFRTLYDSTSDAVMLLDVKGFFDCNPATLAMFGCASREEFCAKHPADVSPPRQPDGADSVTLANQQIATAMEKGSHKFEWTHRRADTGGVFPAEVLLSAMELDGKQVLQAAVRDITARKRDEEALRKITTRLAHAMSLAQLAAWEYDVDSGLFTFSDSYYALHGTTAKLENGNLMSAEVFARKIVHPDDAHLVAEAIAKAVATTDPDYHLQQEARLFRRDGEIRHVLVNFGITKDAAGRTIQIQGANQDITERKRLEAHLFQSQKMETVGKLAGGVAHQFNSMLTAIIGRSQVLQGELPAGSPLIEHTTEIIEAADHAATLTRQLLAYGRKQFLQPVVLDLNRVIANMEDLLRQLLGNEVYVHIVSGPGLQGVKADPDQIEQVIVNMVINARDAMPDGGKLTLQTANISLHQESVGRYPDLKPGDYVMLAITDTGTGMREEVKARIFEPFFTTKGIGQGAGLGLSACYGTIKQSGGHIGVQSEPGRGTTFKIYLPQVERLTNIPDGQ